MPGRTLRDLTYDDWIEHVFGHAVPFHGQAWYNDLESDQWSPTPQQAVDYLLRLFAAPEALLQSFALGQIAQGFYYLIDSGAGGFATCFNDDTVPSDRRARGIRAMTTVFAKLFEPICTPTLSHLDEPGAGALNQVCYMWWDIMPIGAAVKPAYADPINEACLAVMRETLALTNPACQESALHGLGHWAFAYPEFTAAAIDAYLAANPTLRPELARYALAARSGCVN